MARTLSPAIATSVSKESTTLAHTWKFTRSDGVTLRITDHDQPIRVTGDGIYRSSIGFTPSAVVNSATNFGSQQCECTMAMTDDGLREVDVRARKWSNASAVFGIIDWVNPTAVLPVFSGTFGRIATNNRSQVTIEILGIGNTSLNLANDVYSMTCRNSVGDHKCLINIENFRKNFTVAAVTGSDAFAADNLGGQADGYYSLGQLVWDTGNNAGATSEVQSSLQLTNEIFLFFPTGAPILLGDTGHVYPGCDLLIQTCHDKFSNVLNFNGEPFNVQPRIIAAPASSGSIAGAKPAAGVV